MLRLVTLFGLMTIVPMCASAQEWSEEQQEVWRTVETYWSLNADENVQGFLSYLHDDFSGWTHTNALPRDKAEMAQYLPRGYFNTETILYTVKPVGILVINNTAVVHYYYTRTYEDLSGGQHSDAGRWTDILIKTDDRWLMIADHGGSDAGR